jgi:hypothetical protein
MLPTLQVRRAALALLAIVLVLAGLLFLRPLSERFAHPAPPPAQPSALSAAPAPAEPPRAAAPASPLSTPAPLSPPVALHPARVARGPGDPAEPADEARVEAAAFKAMVPAGGALVTGGWRQPDGRRVLALAMPASAGDADQLVVSTQFLSIPETALADPGWAPMLAEADGRLRLEGGVFDAAELQEFQRQLEAAREFDLLSAPILTLQYEQVASLEISGAAGGIMLSVVASKTGQSNAVELAVSTAEMHQPRTRRRPGLD